MIKLLKNMRWYYWLMAILAILFVCLQVFSDLELPSKLSSIITISSNIEGINGLIESKNPAFGVVISQMVANGDTKFQPLLDHYMVYGFENIDSVMNGVINVSKTEIWNNGLQMLGLAAIAVTSSIIVGYIAARIAAGFSHDLRKKIYRKVQNFSLHEIDGFSTSSLITRSTNDVTQVQMVVVLFLRMAVSAPIMAIRGIILATETSRSSGLENIIIFSVIALVILVAVLFIIVLPKFKKIQKLTDKLNMVTRENLTGLRVVRAYGAQNIEHQKFEEVNNQVSKTNIFVNRMMSIMYPGMMIIMNMTSLAILWAGAYVIDKTPTSETLASVFQFQQYTMMIVMAFMQLTMISIMIPRGSVSGKRIQEVLESKTLINNPDSPQNAFGGEIEFKNVDFSYEGSSESVLSDINFKVLKGETLAIIGSTGCGKSTLVNLIPRFFDTTKGEILINGINVRDYDQNILHDKIGYIPQKALLFSGTIESNLRYGKNDASNEEIEEALEISQSKEFVSKLEDGINHPISQGGTNVSGGQKQRISIARAIIKKPEILIFDDSFSALDFKTDKALRATLNTKIKNCTKIIVAQRIGTIIDADKIIVLEQGKIVGMGKHLELLKNCEVYKEIAYSQLSKEELENAWA